MHYRLAGLCAGMLVAVGGCGTRPSVSVDGPELARVHILAVLPFSDAPGAEGGYSGKTVASVVVQHLMDNPRFGLVERDKIQAVMNEKDFTLAMSEDPAKIARLGKLLGADALVCGSVTQYNTSSWSLVDVYSVGVTFRVVRVANGKVCFVGRCTQAGGSYEDATGKAVSLIVAEISRNYIAAP